MNDNNHPPASGRRPVAVITGASAGIGRATSTELAARGYDVGLVARGQAGLEAAAEEARQFGGRAAYALADVANAEQLDTAAQRLARELGPFDLWVNNAMTTVFSWIHDLTPREIARATEVTYLGQVYGALTALQHMMPRDRGTIVFVGSALSYRGIPLQAAYCASKFAVRGFYESLRTELLHQHSGITATIVHLPAVNTPQFGWSRAKVAKHPMPVPPIYQPEVAARAIANAGQSPPRHKIVGSWNWILIQMAQIMPGVADHYMASTGVNGQLTNWDLAPDRRDNLFEPQDADTDHGPHGKFDDRAQGVLTPRFLKSLPSQGRSLLSSVQRRAEESARRRR